MNSITKNQLSSLLLITDIFILMCFHGGMSAWTLAGLAFGIVLQFTAVLPLTLYVSKGKELPKAVNLLLLIFLAVFGGFIISKLWDTAEVIFVPSETAEGTGGKLLITGLIALVCLYISSTGMKAAGRSAVIAAASGIIFLVIDLVSALIKCDFHNITASSDCGTFTEGLKLSAVLSGGLAAFCVLLPFVKDSRKQAAFRWFSCRIVICSAIILTTLLVTGGIMEICEHPVITAAQLSQPFSSQRIDPLFLMLFVVFGVFSLTAQIMTGACLIRKIFPAFRKWRSSAVLIAAALSALLLTGCSSTGLVHDKAYLRAIGTENDKYTMAFFSEEKVYTVCADSPDKALSAAELEIGRPIVTGFTELIVLGECNAAAYLTHMLNNWKVSPSCLVIADDDPEKALTESDISQLEGSVKEAVKQGKLPKCGIVDVLSELLE